jgi:hypothetical protein
MKRHRHRHRHASCAQQHPKQIKAYLGIPTKGIAPDIGSRRWRDVGDRIVCGKIVSRRMSRSGLSVESIHLLILLKNPKNASTRLSMNGKAPKILPTPPFVLRFSKDERRVFQQNHLFKPNPNLSNLVLEAVRVARFDLSRFEIDITRPSRIRSAPEIGGTGQSVF